MNQKTLLIKSIFLFFTICILFSGCKDRRKDYSYDISGASEWSYPADVSTAQEAEKQDKLIHHKGFSVRFPPGWENKSNDPNYIRYAPNDSSQCSVSVGLSTFTGLEDMDTPDLLRFMAVRIVGMERAKAGTISVQKGFPCWHMDYTDTQDDGNYTCMTDIYLTDTQHMVTYVSVMDDKEKQERYDEMTGIRNSLTVTETAPADILSYVLNTGTFDLWSGITDICIGNIAFHLGDKLTAVEKAGIALQEPDAMLESGESKWIRGIAETDKSILLFIRNDSDMKRSMKDCPICGADGSHLFAGDTYKLDDFGEETVFEDFVNAFGLPVRQEGSMAVWELDGQDLYCSFSQMTGKWARMAVVQLTEQDKTAREEAYIESQQTAQENEWLAGVNG